MKFFDHQTTLDLIRPQIDKRIKKIIDEGQFIQGEELRLFEDQLASFCNVIHCIGTSNGTDALLVSLMALGISPGDEVITPAFSYIAASEACRLLKATLVFIDVEPDTYNIDPSLLPSLITNKTKAIIAIDLFGQPANYAAIREAIAGKNITIIEDAAQSMGAKQLSQRAGSLADIATTSFFPTKPLAGFGDGGAILTNDAEVAQVARQITQHGQSQKYIHSRVGLNARLDTIQAGVLLEKMVVFEKTILQRQQAAQVYNQLIKENLYKWQIVPAFIQENNESVYAQYTIQVPNRDELAASLAKLNIPTAVYYPQPIYKQWKNKTNFSLPITEKLCNSVLSLPFYPGIPKIDQVKVIESLALILANPKIFPSPS